MRIGCEHQSVASDNERFATGKMHLEIGNGLLPIRKRHLPAGNGRPLIGKMHLLIENRRFQIRNRCSEIGKWSFADDPFHNWDTPPVIPRASGAWGRSRSAYCRGWRSHFRSRIVFCRTRRGHCRRCCLYWRTGMTHYRSPVDDFWTGRTEGTSALIWIGRLRRVGGRGRICRTAQTSRSVSASDLRRDGKEIAPAAAASGTTRSSCLGPPRPRFGCSGPWRMAHPLSLCAAAPSLKRACCQRRPVVVFPP